MLINRLEARGYRVRLVSIARLADLRAELEEKRRLGLVDEGVYETYLADFAFAPPEELLEARSIIVVATPQPPVRFTFAWRGRRLSFVVPPTYQHWSDAEVEKALADALAPAGYRVAPATLPKKLLAVRSGLAAYGKNNVTYVPGLGSFFRLTVFYSDLPCPNDDEWREPAVLARCADCDACLRACPPGAIVPDRFLLHAEKCITFHNEKPSTEPLPPWFEPWWHDCLVGCLRCQLACPENEPFRRWAGEGAAFSAEETELLLAGVPLAELPPATAAKLERTELNRLLGVLPRNLRILCERAAAAEPK